MLLLNFVDVRCTNGMAVDHNSCFTLLYGAGTLQGSYGTVRACTHEATGKHYAAKILSKRRNGEQRSEVIAREVCGAVCMYMCVVSQVSVSC
jgi:hypothetical protein